MSTSQLPLLCRGRVWSLRSYDSWILGYFQCIIFTILYSRDEEPSDYNWWKKRLANNDNDMNCISYCSQTRLSWNSLQGIPREQIIFSVAILHFFAREYPAGNAIQRIFDHYLKVFLWSLVVLASSNNTFSLKGFDKSDSKSPRSQTNSSHPMHTYPNPLATADE